MDKFGISDFDLKNYNEWLQGAHEKNLYQDHVRAFTKHFFFLLWLFKITKSLKLALFIDKVEYSVYQRIKSRWNNSPYQGILTNVLKSVEKEVQNIRNFPNRLNKVEVLDIRGFDIFNAESFPCFGENLIAIQSGIFFHSHTLSRSLEFILHADNNGAIIRWFTHIHKKRYVRISIGLICGNHTKSFMPWRFIPIDDSLYHGIELFVVAHEYAHCMYKEHLMTDFNFSAYFSDDILTLIEQDEEVAANAFAIIILDSYVKNNPNDQMAYYGPRFFFKNFCLYESESLIPTPKSHPSYNRRYSYIKLMLSSLRSTINHDVMDEKIDKVWLETKGRIKKLSNKINDNEALVKTIYKDMHEFIRSSMTKKGI